jgi:BirA family transcriptional regulator, biotin operon repressor / biotin---[acetyl-CoA-carboxylase] ligase
MHPAGAAGRPIAPLDVVRLRAAVAAPSAAAGQGAAAGPGAMWTDIRVVAETASTNEDVLKLGGDGAAEGLVIAAESQTAGRGRQGRSWQSRPGAALTFSVLLRPQSVPQAARGWVPLLAGVATARALRRVAAVDARLKWPNDVLLGGGKLAGILAEQSGDAIVVGIGINVLGRDHDLPTATATSLERGGAGPTDRTELLAEILRQLGHWYVRWRETRSGDADRCGLRQEYLSLCATLGRLVRVQLPGDRGLTGTAVDVDGSGQLLIRRDGGGIIAVSAGDVIHVR